MIVDVINESYYKVEPWGNQLVKSTEPKDCFSFYIFCHICDSTISPSTPLLPLNRFSVFLMLNLSVMLLEPYVPSSCECSCPFSQTPGEALRKCASCVPHSCQSHQLKREKRHVSVYVLIHQTVTSGIKHKYNVTWD